MSLEKFENNRMLNKIKEDLCNYIQYNYPFEYLYTYSVDDSGVLISKCWQICKN
jgi:hypothetical protein